MLPDRNVVLAPRARANLTARSAGPARRWAKLGCIGMSYSRWVPPATGSHLVAGAPRRHSYTTASARKTALGSAQAEHTLSSRTASHPCPPGSSLVLPSPGRRLLVGIRWTPTRLGYSRSRRSFTTFKEGTPGPKTRSHRSHRNMKRPGGLSRSRVAMPGRRGKSPLQVLAGPTGNINQRERNKTIDRRRENARPGQGASRRGRCQGAPPPQKHPPVTPP